MSLCAMVGLYRHTVANEKLDEFVRTPNDRKACDA